MKWIALCALGAVLFFSGVGTGLLYAGYFTTTTSADARAEKAVGRAVADTRTVDASDEALRASRQRAKASVKESVDVQCPPGRGPVSDAAAERLRLALERASASALRAREP